MLHQCDQRVRTYFKPQYKRHQRLLGVCDNGCIDGDLKAVDAMHECSDKLQYEWSCMLREENEWVRFFRTQGGGGTDFSISPSLSFSSTVERARDSNAKPPVNFPGYCERRSLCRRETSAQRWQDRCQQSS